MFVFVSVCKYFVIPISIIISMTFFFDARKTRKNNTESQELAEPKTNVIHNPFTTIKQLTLQYSYGNSDNSSKKEYLKFN